MPGNSQASTAAPARIFRVDPTTGNRTVISESDVFSNTEIGAGPKLYAPVYARDMGDHLLFTSGGLMKIAPATGDRTLIWGTGDERTGALSPGGLLVSGHTAVVALAGLVTVDLSTGTFSVLGTTRTGPFYGAIDIVASGGQLFASALGPASTNGETAILRIDPITGNRTVLANSTVGSGTVWGTLEGGIAAEAGGTLLATAGESTEPNFNGLLAINPVTGNRTFLSDATHGTGPSFANLALVTVVPLLGDANNDGVVNGLDIALAASSWQHAGLFLPGDLNGDGVVNGLDISQIASHWLSTSLPVSGAAASATSVPEPATIMLALLGASMIASRRCRTTAARVS